jgi:uncharacterized protein
VHKRFAAVAIALCVATAALALDIPPKPTAWVTDNANILTPEQEQALNERLEALKTKAGAEFLVMTLPSLEGEDVLGYTNRVAEQWKVKDDKALMLFVFPKDRKMWIQVGYGLEAVITDAYSSRVYRNTLVPAFRQERYYEGIDEAITQLGQKVDPTFSPQSRSLPPSGGRGASGAQQVGVRDIFFLLFILFVFVAIIGPIMRRRGGCGGCNGCFWPMFFWPGGGGGTTFGGGGGGGGSNWSVGGSWGGGGGSSFGGGGAGGGW